MGLEGTSIGRVKFQPAPASTERERGLYLADSGKKVLPGAKRFLSRLSFGRINATKGINFFSCVQDLFDEALSP